MASTLMLLGALQGLFLGLALLEKRKRRASANRVLAALMFLTALRLANAALFYSDSGEGNPFSLAWTVGLILTYPPLLYLYVRALISPADSWRLRDALHFLPACFLGTWLAARYLLNIIRGIGAEGEALQELGINAAWLIQASVYIFFILGLRRRHIRSASQVLSARDGIYLDWVRNLVLSFALIVLLTLLYLLHVTLRLPLPATPSVFLHLSIAGIVLAWGYLGFRQPEVFAPQALDIKTRKESPDRNEDRAPSAAPEDSEAHRVIEHMEREKPYLSPDLSLFDLARALDLPAYQLSAVLNRKLGKTFFEFVNAFRVEEAKRRLLDPAGANLKILALALECGFNSKSAFNRVFKELAGQTPSAFQRRGRAAG